MIGEWVCAIAAVVLVPIALYAMHERDRRRFAALDREQQLSARALIAALREGERDK